MDDKVKVAVDHLKTHVTYPATTEQIKEACGSWSDVDPELKGKSDLLEAGKTWNSAEEVLAALGWPTDGTAAPADGNVGGTMPASGGAM